MTMPKGKRGFQKGNALGNKKPLGDRPLDRSPLCVKLNEGDKDKARALVPDLAGKVRAFVAGLIAEAEAAGGDSNA